MFTFLEYVTCFSPDHIQYRKVASLRSCDLALMHTEIIFRKVRVWLVLLANRIRT